MATIMRREELMGAAPAPAAVRVERDSGVSWGAILGGAFAAAALSLILLALGSGLGLSSISLWSYADGAAVPLGPLAIVWLFAMSAVASAVGGYLTGRLRAKWTDIDADEIHFRDTAHGLIAWAVATVVSATVLTTAAANMTGTAVTAAVAGLATGATDPAGMATAPDAGGNYFADMLFRSDRPTESPDSAAMRAEAARILTGAQRQGDLSLADKAYLAQQISARTGIAQSEAEARTASVFASAQAASAATKARAVAAAESARQATAHLALWIFAALLTGAFCAAAAAALGGHHRDYQYARRFK